MKHLRPSAFVALTLALLPQLSDAGSFIAVSQDLPDLVAHQNYYGTGGELSPIKVCIDNSLNPALGTAAEPAVRNVIATYNRFRSLPDNTFAVGAATSAPPDQVDFETVLLHEFLHAHGLDHPNQADNPAGSGAYNYYDTRSSGGANGALDRLGDADGLPGSADDQRGDDVNLHWYVRGANDPAVSPAIVDTTTMARVLDYLPPGQHFAANGNADVMAALGHANSKAVAVQGYVQGRVGHHLHSDDLAMLRLAHTGVDGIAGTADDYHSTAVFAGYFNNPQGSECSIVVRFDDNGGQVSFAGTTVGLTPIAPNQQYRLIYPTRMRFNPAVNWYFTPGANTVMQIDPATPATSVGVAPFTLQVTVGKAAFNTMSGSPRGTVVVRDGPRDDAQTATCSIDLAPQSGGTGSCAFTPLTAGHKTLTADFLGWGGWDGNTATATHDALGTVAFSNVTHTPTPSSIGVAVAFDWTLAPPANAAPVQATGTVVVKESADCASAPIVAANQCTATLPAHTCSIAFAAVGTHTLQLCYGGDSAVSPASASVTHPVLAGRPTATAIVAVSAPQTRPFEPYNVQVQVREAPVQGGFPQGAVVVSDGDDADLLTAHCTAMLAGTANEVASCQLASNRAGAHALTATFASQGQWIGSSSVPSTHAVANFAIVANNPTSVPLGQDARVIVALDVSPFRGTAPTGTIVVGDGVDICRIVLPATQCLWRGSSAGTHQLTATWSGDANYPAMTTAAVTQTVTPGALYPLWVSQAQAGYPDSNAASTGTNQGLSADGRFVVFSSVAGDLVGDDSNGVEDVFVRDQLNGAVRRVSVTAAGVQGNGASRWPSISANGRYVAFQSEASNFFPGDGNDKDIFVKDLYTGALVRATTLANGAAPTSAELGLSTVQLRSSLSADGRYVAFSTYRGLATGDSNGAFDVYVKDLVTGALDLVSSDGADNPGNSHSQWPALSADGRYVVFNSQATNLVPGLPSGNAIHVFVKDRQTRAVALASAAANGTPSDGTCADYPAISADGRVVAFQCDSSNLPSAGWTSNRVFVKDMTSGAIELAAQGGTYSNSLTPALSADGRYVAFQVGVTTTPRYVGVFVKDRLSGSVVNQHVTPSGAPALEEQVSWETRMWPSISADGTVVAFQSVSTTIAPPDNNGAADVFVRDTVLGRTQRASGTYYGLRNDGDSGNAAISRDGGMVLYDSASTALIDADANGARDVFLYASGSTTRISTAADSTPGNGASFAPALAEGAGDVYFLSAASNLATSDTNGRVDVFRKHLADGSIERMNLNAGAQSTADAQAPLAVSRDGRLLAFASADSGLADDHNGVTDILVYRRGGAGVTLTPGSNGNSLQPAMSDDGRMLAFASDATNLGVGGNAVRNVFVRNLRENVPNPLQLVSADANGVAANGASEQPAVSADGRYVAFVSRATNLVPGDDNGAADIFVKDLVTGAVERVNTTASGAQGAGGDCAAPSFSSGARFVGFVCAQANLVPGGSATAAFYVKDRSSGAITRLSQNAAGVAADAAGSAGSHALADSGAGVFSSAAGNFGTLDTPLIANVFLNRYPAAFAASTVDIVSISPAQPLTGRGYTVNVSVSGAGANPPTGRVRVFDGSDFYPSCEATLTPGTPSTGSCTLATGASGNWTLTAYYGGDDANAAANSLPYAVAVQDPVAPAKPNIISAVPGNGSVALQIAVGTIGAPFTGYTATCGTQSQNSTSVPITVSGLQNGVAVNCTVIVHNGVGDSPASDPFAATPQAGTSTSIVAQTPNPSRVNNPYTVSVAVLGEGTPAPGGTVAVSDGVASCTAALTPGVPSTGSCALVSTARGNRMLSASYAGDAANTVSSSTATHAIADAPAAPTLTQAAPGNGSATLTFSAPADDGGSALLDYTATCGTRSITGPAPLLTVSGLTNDVPVSCSVTARNAVAYSTPSNALSVTPAPARVATTLALSGGGEPGTWNQTASFRATLAPVPPATATPSGTVTFNDAGAPIAGCVNLALTTTAPITADCSTAALGVGVHAVTAQYGGDGTYAAAAQAVSNTLSHTVQRATSTVDFGTLNFIFDGNAKTIAAHIHDEPGTSCSVTPASVGPNAGSTPLTATCSGTNYTASGGATAVIAKAATTLTLSSACMRTFVEGQPYTLLATLGGGVNASGSARFDDGQNALCTSVPFASGTAACRTTPSANGQRMAHISFGATYGGDADNLSSQSGSIAVTVLGLAEAIFRNGFERPGDPDACPIE